MNNRTDKGRSVCGTLRIAEPAVVCLSLLLVFTAIGTSFCTIVRVSAEEERKPLAAVSVSAEPLTAVAVTAQTAEARTEAPAQTAGAAEPLTAMAVEAEPLQATAVVPEVAKPASYVNDYLGFTRTQLVSYLVENADSYLGTPYKEETVAPVPGRNGHMQCEGFIWDVMRAVATQNETDIPCGNIRTEPANGGGWVNWSYYHNVDPITFNTKEEMLASGVLEKGDVIWSFDYAGPYGLSNSNHVGFFWGDNPHDDKFWESAVKTGADFFAGSADGNRIAGIESMAKYPSVWWVFKLSPDNGYDPAAWTGLPEAGVTDGSAEDGEPDAEEDEENKEILPEADAVEETAAESSIPEETAEEILTVEEDAEQAEPAETGEDEAVSEDTAEKSQSADMISSTYEAKGSAGMVFYNGDEEDAGYYGNFIAELDPGYYAY